MIFWFLVFAFGCSILAIMYSIPFVAGPAIAVIAWNNGGRAFGMLTYAGMKNINGEPTNFRNSPIPNPKYDAENVAFAPNPIATNLCANSCSTIAGAVMYMLRKNACLSNPGFLTGIPAADTTGIFRKSLKIYPTITIIATASSISRGVISIC